MKKNKIETVYGPLVDIVAPAWKSRIEDLHKGMELLQSWGLHSRYPDKMFSAKSLMSNEDPERFEFLKNAILNPDSDIIWGVRGGFGSMRLIPKLLKMKKPSRAKSFIGLSDLSTLHLFFNQIWDWQTIHGPMLDRLGARPPTAKYLKELRELVCGREKEICFSHLKPMNKAALRSQKISGRITGGNLVTLQSSLKTKIEWQTRGKILFLEEIGERGYRIDRFLQHFAQVGLWAKPKALVLGDFTGGQEPDGKDHSQRILKEFAEAQSFPIYKGLQSGHGQIQRPIPFNTASTLFCGSNAKLISQWPKNK